MGLPEFIGDQCDACEKCVAICPGLAVTLVDFRKDAEYPTVTVPHEFTAQSIKTGDIVTVLDTEGAMLGNVEVTRVREAKANDRCLMVKVRAPPRDRVAHRGHPRPGTVGHRAVGAARPAPGRRDDRVPVRARDGRRDPRPHPRRRPRPERAEGDHAGRHGRVRRQDLPEPHQAAVPGGRRARQPDHRLHQAAGVHGGAARRLRRRLGRRRAAGGCPVRHATGRARREACDEHRHLRRRHRRRRQRGIADGAVPRRAGHQAARHRPVRQRRPGQQQGGDRRHPRHAFVAGEDPPVPRVAPHLLVVGADLRRRASSGRRAATSSWRTGRRKSAR